MVLPLKLGTLALKTLSKPIAARLKREAGIHPKFRNFIVSIAQLLCSLRYKKILDQKPRRRNFANKKCSKSSVSTCNEFHGMRQRDDELAKEVELLKQKIEKIEQFAKGRGLAGVFNFRHTHS